jgi:quercetin dioxygenase-like cupin family protein
MVTNTPGRIVAPDQGSVWEMEAGRPITFKLPSEQTGDRVAVFEEVAPAGKGTPLHIHHTSDEVIYILAGTFTVKLGEHVATGGPGTWVFVPRGTRHGWKNSGVATGRAFFILTPAEGAKPFEELRHMQVPITAIDPATFKAISQQYGNELVTFDW